MKLLRLIIVEDSVDDTLLLLLELKRGGYETDHLRVETAEALEEALSENRWDLIISDHSLPSFSAPEALSVLNRSGYDLPFIIVSSIIGEEVAVAAMKAGAQDYIMKDRLPRLVPVIERALYDAGIRAERKKAREALKESEARFCRLAENAVDLIYRLHLIPEWRFDYINSSLINMIGYRPEEFYADPNLGLESIHPDDRQLFLPSAPGKFIFRKPLVLRWRCKDGRAIWVEHRNVPVYNRKGKLIAVEGIGRDITERVLYEQQLAMSHSQIEALTSRILTAMEEERSRLARELHDELGQALTAVKLDLQLLDDNISGGGIYGRNLAQSIGLIDDTINLVRRQSVSLRPPALDDMGLLPALDEMVAGFIRRTGISVRIENRGFSIRLPGHVETALYRCVQESLTNIARHARAQNVVIEFKRDNGRLSIAIADDGIGFDPDKLKISVDHIGLTGMQERVKLLAGKLKVNSVPGLGTEVTVIIPWRDLIDEEIAL
jgi:two-component system, NarL family, sensor histidine kinase UhpB